MARIGYFLSTEEYTPAQLVEQASLAEAAGFEALWISDHFHPWNDEQGQSPLVWSVIGAISQVCSLPVTTAVTCPTFRLHPAVVAQAAATSSVMLKGRFTLGVGTGEALNEHIVGISWPSIDERLDRLVEAVDVIRKLWDGGFVTHRGRHYTVDSARVYTLPDEPPQIYVSALGPEALDVAVSIGDGYISTVPDADLVRSFKERTTGKPAMGGTKVAYAASVDEGVEIAHRLWATSGIPGELAQVLPSPRHFEQASQLVTEDMTRSSVPCGPNPKHHLEAVTTYLDAGYDEVYVANMGPHYRAMMQLWHEEVLPQLRGR